MSIDQLRTGCVIRFPYLWVRESERGETEGRKPRPVAVGVRISRPKGEDVLVARRKIDVSIPVRSVSPIVYLDRLYLFWNEIATSSRNIVKDGASTFVGYRHKSSIEITPINCP